MKDSFLALLGLIVFGAFYYGIYAFWGLGTMLTVLAIFMGIGIVYNVLEKYGAEILEGLGMVIGLVIWGGVAWLSFRLFDSFDWAFWRNLLVSIVLGMFASGASYFFFLEITEKIFGNGGNANGNGNGGGGIGGDGYGGLGTLQGSGVTYKSPPSKRTANSKIEQFLQQVLSGRKFSKEDISQFYYSLTPEERQELKHRIQELAASS